MLDGLAWSRYAHEMSQQPSLEDLDLLGITWEMLVAVVNQPARLDALREWGKQGFREIARTSHPDVGGDVEVFHRSNRARLWLQTASILAFAELVGLDEFVRRRDRAARMVRVVDGILH